MSETRPTRPWLPRRVLITRSALAWEHGQAIAARAEALGIPVERLASDRLALGLPDDAAAAYAAAAVPVMRLQSLLTANVRVWAVCIACLLGSPRIFFWFEIVPLTLVCAAGLFRHRRVERRFVHGAMPQSILYPSEQGHS